MKERMQKTLAAVKGYPRKDRLESEEYVGVQTFMWMREDNIVEVPFDKELERRGLPFVRYADDSMIFCKSKRAAMRVRESITRFIEGELYLKVNKEKTVVSYVKGVKYLGYSFYVSKGKCQLAVHPKSKAKMKAKLKELTSRSNGWGYAKRKQKLEEYIRGWVGYYHLANMKRLLMDTDSWLRRRIRMCIWKAWKLPKTRIKNLMRCGINKYDARRWGYVKGYWGGSRSPIMQPCCLVAEVARCGLSYAGGLHISKGAQNRNCRMRNRMYGGVRGR